MKKVLSSILLAISILSLSACVINSIESSSNKTSSPEESQSPSISESLTDSSIPNEESSSPSEDISSEDSSSLSDEPIGLTITSNDTNGTTTFSKSKGLEEGEEVEITFTPNGGYTLLSYTIINDNGSVTIPSYKDTNASLTITSDTVIEANYIKTNNVESFNYCSGESKLIHFIDGKYQNSAKTTTYTEEEVLACMKDSESNSIDSSIFSITPITTFANGKWANPYYSKNNYGLSLYSSETEYSGITFNSLKTIYSITITYYNENYYDRAFSSFSLFKI